MIMCLLNKQKEFFIIITCKKIIKFQNNNNDSYKHILNTKVILVVAKKNINKIQFDFILMCDFMF